MKIIVRLVSNIAGLWIANYFVAGLVIASSGTGFKEFIIAGTLLGLLNLVVKPLLKLVSAPIILITLGLFTLVINAIMVLAVDYILKFVTIQSLGALIWTTIIVSIVNIMATSLTKSKKSKDN